MQIEKSKIAKIKEICKIYRVKNLSVFGSAVRDDLKESSDIDFLVDFVESDPIIYTDLYFRFKGELEKILNRPIDLIEERALKNRFFIKELEETKIPLYG